MEVKRIPLTQNRFAIVDAADYERLSVFKWQVNINRHTCYAVRTNGRGKIKMHREILQPPGDMHCDHINHDGLDNRRCNLRICTPAQNCYNKRPLPNHSSQYKGVSFEPVTKKWRAIIKYHGIKIHIGFYEFEQDAAIAYDDLALQLFGEFAYLNHNFRPEINQWLKQTYLFA